MTAIWLANPEHIDYGSMPSRRDIAVQKRRLEAEGQIEPLIVEGKQDLRLVFDSPHSWLEADAQVCAALELGWDSMLVTDRASAEQTS